MSFSHTHDDQRMAGGPGIEPGFTDPKSVVLPLDDPPTGESPYRLGLSQSRIVTGVVNDHLLIHPTGDHPMPIIGHVNQQAAQIHFRQVSRDFILGEGTQ